MDPATLIAIFGPVAVEAIKTILQRIAPDNFKPATLADFVEVKRLDLEFFKTMNAPGGETYKWVEAVRQLQRPIVAALVTFNFLMHPDSVIAANTAGVVWFYLFGEKTLLRTGGKK